MSGRGCALLLAVLVTACGRAGVEPGELPGFYRMRGGEAEDVLVLCADSVWVNRYRRPGAAVVSSSGSWEVVPTSYGDQHLLLRGYPRLWKTGLPTRDTRRADAGSAEGYTAMLVDRGRGGAVRLIVDVDSERGYLQDRSVDAVSQAAQACSGPAPP